MSYKSYTWYIATIILLSSKVILTEKIVKQHLGTIKNYKNEYKSIELEASKLLDDVEVENNKQENEESESETSHNRQKRMIWITDDGRLALPPGTTLIIAPTLGLPFIRYPPDGFHSNISISLPLTSEY